MVRIVITGGCGFIGHHLVQHVLKNTDWSIVVIDKLSYASMGLQRLRDIDGGMDNQRVTIFTYDLSVPLEKGMIDEIGDVDYIVHMAAETHVDNSIENPVHCVKNNVLNTLHLLEFARGLKTLKKFLYFSTDEVYGPALGDVMYKEWDRHCPTNPYSASKSAGEMLCLSYQNTYGIPAMICNVMNVFGERQHVEKFIPMCIRNTILGEEIPIHSYPGCQVPGTRFYIHARNVASAVMFLFDNGKIGDKYNISGEQEISNLEIAELISKELNMKQKIKMVDYHSTRPGHDLRYGLNGDKMMEMGWHLPKDFHDSLKKTVSWYVEHKGWLGLPDTPEAFYLNATNMGIGNLVMTMSSFMAFERQRLGKNVKPVVYCLRPYYLKCIRTELFNIVSEAPPGLRIYDTAISLTEMYLSRELIQVMHEIVSFPPLIIDIRTIVRSVDAAFCIRTSDPGKWPGDTNVNFMNNIAIDAMIVEMQKYSKVLVCTNDSDAIHKLLPSNAIYLSSKDPCEGIRGWIEWHAISMSPIVYHGVRTRSDDKSMTSTFAATAAAYGFRKVIGVDNDGIFYHLTDDKNTDNYYW